MRFISVWVIPGLIIPAIITDVSSNAQSSAEGLEKDEILQVQCHLPSLSCNIRLPDTRSSSPPSSKYYLNSRNVSSMNWPIFYLLTK